MAVQYPVSVCNSLTEVNDTIKEHEIEMCFKYVSLKKEKLFGKESGFGKLYCTTHSEYQILYFDTPMSCIYDIGYITTKSHHLYQYIRSNPLIHISYPTHSDVKY